MFCTKCGNRLDDDARFCPVCGTRVEAPKPEAPAEGQSPQQGQNFAENQGFAAGQAAPQGVKEERHPAPRKRKKTGVIIGAVCGGVAAAVLVVGIVLFMWNRSLNSKSQDLAREIDEYNIASCSEEKDTVMDGWKDGNVFGFADKNEQIKKLEAIRKTASEYDQGLKSVQTSLAQMDSEKEKYDLAGSYADYAAALTDCAAAVDQRDYELASDRMEEVQTKLEQLIADNEALVSNKVSQYQMADMAAATEDEAALYNESMEQISQLEAAGDYSGIGEILDQMDSFVYQYVASENPLNIKIQQVDASAFPEIKLYVRLEDAATGDVPENLEQSLFFVRKQDANANYIRQTLSRVTQLNEAEALNINMVADVSGSMDGSPLREAKEIMSNFIGSVQFDAGDQVELISFSTGVFLEQEFTGDGQALTSRIQSLQTDNMTSLYDALYTAVTRTASQSGAKCVIAFTDGKDNYSSCSFQEVISVATRYHVPIFIIGVGDVDSAELQSMADQTGGLYFNINNISSMQDIYDEIYRQEKELYLIEFTDESGMDMSDTANIIVGYHSATYGGDCQYSYTPNVLLSVEGTSLYEDGPEAVVEKYIRAFDTAMTNSDFSQISPYLKEGSAIYESQKSYVQKNISEMLDTYEIVSVDYSDDDHCVVTTRETYYVQIPGKSLYLLTQQCKYVVERVNGSDWKMTDFADSVDVLSTINQ